MVSTTLPLRAAFTTWFSPSRRLTDLANMFEFPQLMEPLQCMLATLWEDLIMVKDVWDTTALCE